MNPTPEQLAEMYAWYQARQTQQLSYPVDDASRNALGTATFYGTSGTNPVTTIGSTPANVALIPTGFIILTINGAQYTMAYYT